jgi:hypothetical protein
MLFMSFGAVGHTQTNIWKKVTITKAFESKTEDDNNPATFAFTIPKDTSNSYLINAGIGFDFVKPTKKSRVITSGTAFFLYNRNTLIDEKTKNYKLGITVGHFIDINEYPTTAIFGSTSIQYMHNYIDTTHSFIATNYWHPMYKSTSFIHIGGYMATPHIVDYYFLPQAGLEYQKVFDANSKSKEGYDAMFYFNTTLKVRVKKKTRFSTDEIKQIKLDSLYDIKVWQNKTLKEAMAEVDKEVPEGTTREMPSNTWLSRFVFSFSYTGRSSFANHNSNFENYMPLLTAGVDFFPFNNNDVSLGVSYNDGANPIDGTPKQTYWLLSVNFKK